AGSDPLDPASVPPPVPALTGPGVALFLLFLSGGVLWWVRRRHPRTGTAAGLLLLGLGVTLLSPGEVTPQGGPPERVLYIHTDHLGTPLKLTDSLQTVVWSGTAEPFGETDTQGSSTILNLRFPGQYRDPETGLHHNYFRMYHSGIGSYLEPDPYGQFGDALLYRYVYANPVVRVDQTGRIAGEEILIGGAICGPVCAGVIAGVSLGATLAVIFDDELEHLAEKLRQLLNEDREAPNDQEEETCPAPEQVSESPNVRPSFVPQNPADSPGEGWEWRGNGPPGSKEGSWHNPVTGESLHPDLDHPAPIGPHWDYKGADKSRWRIFPGGRMEPKK
ncbi:MAG: RHS repeat-associated core domain-containing protein, partial [bacterium]|nr:RHS repeat-associated core domain-containing protein [bacterium]